MNEQHECTGCPGAVKEPLIVGPCATCDGPMYDYEKWACEKCGAEMHRGCVKNCDQCGSVGCKCCMIPDDLGEQWFCETTGYTDEQRTSQCKDRKGA